ncbi:MAG: LptF/LptG family permease [Candidatus Eremiobacteraeota bacterium]|nr:LptF/LptG family permease [Candidatus Eremiobacteraeota bacterium]
MKILDRYVLSEMIFPFFYGVAAFTVLFMSVSSSEIISNMIAMGSQNLSLVMRYILCSMPQVLVYTFPMAVLLSTLLAFGRLSGDSEIIAMKAGGISLVRIGIPGLFLTFVISLVSFYLGEYVVPDANYTATNILIRQIVQEAKSERENLIISDVDEEGTERRIFAKSLDEERGLLRGVVIFYFRNNHRLREVYAPKAVWENNIWRLIDPRTYDFDENQGIKYESRSEVGRLPIDVGPSELAKRDRKPEEMNRTRLKRKLEVMKVVAAKSGSNDTYSRTYRRMMVIFHQKLSLPFTCMVFGLFGIPLGLRPHRATTSIGLGLSLVFILLFYVLMTVGRALGENGTLPAWLGSWAPNVIFGGLGLGMLLKAAKT